MMPVSFFVSSISSRRENETGDWEGPGRIGDEHAQECEQGILVLMSEADATTTQSEG